MPSQRERDALKVLQSCDRKVKKIEADVTSAVQRIEELRLRELRVLKEAIRCVQAVVDGAIAQLEGRGHEYAAKQILASDSSPVKE